MSYERMDDMDNQPNWPKQMTDPAPASREAEIAARLEKRNQQPLERACQLVNLALELAAPDASTLPLFDASTQLKVQKLAHGAFEEDYFDLRYLLAQLQQARQERDGIEAKTEAIAQREIERAHEMAQRSSAALQQAREALKGVEWINVRDEGGRFYPTCPFCWADKEARGGHVVGCGLDAALKAVR